MTILEIKTGNPSPEIAKAQLDNYMRMVDLTADIDTKKVSFTPSETEMEKLEALIKERHPDWHIEVEPCFEGQKMTLVLHDRYVCDAVCHYYSFGSEEGLLEWWNQKDQPVGWLSAEEALVLFEEELKEVRESLEEKK